MPTLPQLLIGDYCFDPNRNALQRLPPRDGDRFTTVGGARSRGRAPRDAAGEASEIVLEPLAAEVLSYLARHAGEVLSKEELIASVWRGSIVSDGPLYRVVALLRNVLGDDKAAPRYIQTISKRGYRLIADVQPLDGGVDTTGGAVTATGQANGNATAGAPGEDDEDTTGTSDSELDITLTQVVGHTAVIVTWLDEEGQECRREFRHAFTIGRGRRCELRLADASVSRAHTRVTCRAGRWIIEDLDSTNGTEVNGERVTESELAPGVHELRVSPSGPRLELRVLPLRLEEP